METLFQPNSETFWNYLVYIKKKKYSVYVTTQNVFFADMKFALHTQKALFGWCNLIKYFVDH